MAQEAAGAAAQGPDPQIRQFPQTDLGTAGSATNANVAEYNTNNAEALTQAITSAAAQPGTQNEQALLNNLTPYQREAASGLLTQLSANYAQQAQDAEQQAKVSEAGLGDWHNWVHGVSTVAKGLDIGAGEVLNTIHAGGDLVTGHSPSDVNWSASGAEQMTGANLHTFGNAIGSVPGVKPVSKGLNWLDDTVLHRGFGRFALAAVAGAQEGHPWSLDWNQAASWQNAKGGSSNVGTDLAAFFTGSFKLSTINQENLQNLQSSNVAFNLTSLAANTYAVGYDPGFLGLKAAGYARDLRAGKIAADSRTGFAMLGDTLTGGGKAASDLRLKQLTAGSEGQAAQIGNDAAKAAKWPVAALATRVRSAYNLNLYQARGNLKAFAKAVDVDTFSRSAAFTRSASGTAMAHLFHAAMNEADPARENMLWRVALGDPTAIDELKAESQQYADMIRVAQGEVRTARWADETDALLARHDQTYKDALASGMSEMDAQNAAHESMYLHPDMEMDAPALARRKGELAGYEGYQDWINQVVPSLSTAGENAANSIFGNLDRMGTQAQRNRLMRYADKNNATDWDPSHFADRGGWAKSFIATPWSIGHTILHWGDKQMLHRVGVVDLTDKDNGMVVLKHYLDQVESLTGSKSPIARSAYESAWMRSTDEMGRSRVLSALEEDAQKLILRKHGVSQDAAQALTDYFLEKKADSFKAVADNAYAVTPDSTMVDFNHGGDVLSAHLPISSTQIKNHHPLVNLTDFDSAVKAKRDVLHEWDRIEGEGMPEGWGNHLSQTERLRRGVNILGDQFNKYWKPAALLSLRWPERMAQDEALRAVLTIGMMPYFGSITGGATRSLLRMGKTSPVLARGVTHWLDRTHDKLWFNKLPFLGQQDDDALVTSSLEPHDYRDNLDPQRAIPADALASLGFDQQRADRIAEQASDLKRNPEAVEQALAARTAGKPGGIIFDPATGDVVRSPGYVVSHLRGQMVSRGTKPTGRTMATYVANHAHVLGDPESRVAAWFDRDTGRWHMDVVHTFDADKGEQALNHAAAFGAYDVMRADQGFKRYVLDWAGGRPGLNEVDHEPFSLFDSEHTDARNLPATKVQPKFEVRGTGHGQIVAKSADGKILTRNAVYQQDNGSNVWFGAHSSRAWTHSVMTGQQYKFDEVLGGSAAEHERVYRPGDKGWSKAYAWHVNHTVRYDPIAQKLLGGEKASEIADWLNTTAPGRKVLTSLGSNGKDARALVEQHNAVLKNLIPGDLPQLRATIAQREISASEVKDLIPNELRMEVNGSAIHQGLDAGSWRSAGQIFHGGVNALMRTLSTVPHDALARHPLASHIYTRDMRNFIASHDSSELNEDVLNAAAASARSKATKAIREYMMNNTDERQLAHATRWLFPFYGAKMEILEKYLRIGYHQPESIAKLNAILTRLPYVGGNLWSVQDANGNPIPYGSADQGYNGNNSIVLNPNGILMKGLRAIDPALAHETLKYSFAQLESTFRGEVPWQPPIGVPIQAAAAAYFKQHPEMEDQGLAGKLHKLLFPMGDPTGTGVLGTLGAQFEPSWMKRVGEGFGLQSTKMDSSFNTYVTRHYFEAYNAWVAAGEPGGQAGAPTEAQAVSDALDTYKMRGLMGFLLPAAPSLQGEDQNLVDIYRSVAGSPNADQLWAQKAGIEYGSPKYWADWLIVHAGSSSGDGMNASDAAKVEWDKYNGLIRSVTQAGQPSELVGILTGSTAAGNNYQFSQGVYEWQARTSVADANPDGTGTIRTMNDPNTEINKLFTDRGWAQWTALNASKLAVLRQRGQSGGSDNLNNPENADLKQAFETQVQNIYNANPGFQQAFLDSQSKGKMLTLLQQSYSALFQPDRLKSDQEYATRPDLVGLRTYLATRQEFTNWLDQQGVKGGFTWNGAGVGVTKGLGDWAEQGSFTGKTAAVAQVWQGFVQKLIGSNPGFANIYQRYFLGDNLSVRVDPSVVGTNVQNYAQQ